MERIARHTALAFMVVAVVLLAAGCPVQVSEPSKVGAPPAPAPADAGREPASATPATSRETQATRPQETGPSGTRDVQVISHGQVTEIADYVVRGKTTIVDFYSDGCPPCRALAPRLERLAESREDIALVVVDINRPGRRGIDWQSPVARQHNLHSIPHLRVFDANGHEQARGDEARRLVQGWLG